jgi:hypothetical protein
MQAVEALECSRIALLSEADGLGLRYFPSIDSSRSGHATRRGASLIAMRHLLGELYL